MKKLIRMEYNNKSKELVMTDEYYDFKEGEKSKVLPVSITGDDFYDPKSFVFYYEYKNKAKRFDEAKDYFYSLNIDFNKTDYLKLQDYSIRLNNH